MDSIGLYYVCTRRFIIWCLFCRRDCQEGAQAARSQESDASPGIQGKAAGVQEAIPGESQDEGEGKPTVVSW